MCNCCCMYLQPERICHFSVKIYFKQSRFLYFSKAQRVFKIAYKIFLLETYLKFVNCLLLEYDEAFITNLI